MPPHLREDTCPPELIGAGNSTEPRDNIWLGRTGDFDVDQALALDRDPEDALGQIVGAIVASRPVSQSRPTTSERIDIAVAAILGRRRKRGPKDDWARVDKRAVLARAAFKRYERDLDAERGSDDWKSCMWDALTDKERRKLGGDRQGEKFINFYNEAMKFIPTEDLRNKLLFEASVHDEKTREPNLEQWGWRQRRIDRVIGDLRALGVIRGDRGKSTG